MAQQLKSWESPRREGRNRKGRGGSAKQRQYKKRQKQLRKRLQAGINASAENPVRQKEAQKASFLWLAMASLRKDSAA